jgi:hypothetical protein
VANKITAHTPASAFQTTIYTLHPGNPENPVILFHD